MTGVSIMRGTPFAAVEEVIHWRHGAGRGVIPRYPACVTRAFAHPAPFVARGCRAIAICGRYPREAEGRVNLAVSIAVAATALAAPNPVRWSGKGRARRVYAVRPHFVNHSCLAENQHANRGAGRRVG